MRAWHGSLQGLNAPTLSAVERCVLYVNNHCYAKVHNDRDTTTFFRPGLTKFTPPMLDDLKCRQPALSCSSSLLGLMTSRTEQTRRLIAENLSLSFSVSIGFDRGPAKVFVPPPGQASF